MNLARTAKPVRNFEVEHSSEASHVPQYQAVVQFRAAGDEKRDA
jgi:hypothetical protein